MQNAWMLTLVQLRHFVGLARAGSFVKGAQELCLTQPALSRSIKSLEDELGQPLFDRTGRRIELTPFGRQTLDAAQRLLEDAAALRERAGPLNAQHAGRARIGLGSGPGALLTTPLLVHFAQHFPRFHVDVVRANTQTLAQMLRDRQIDAMVVDARSLVPAPDLHVDEWFELEGAFLVRKGHPLAKAPKVSMRQMLQYPVASTPLSDELARILVERYGEQAHPQAMVKLVSDEIAHLVQVAQDSNAVLLAVRDVAPELVPLKMHPPLKATGRYGLVTLAHRAQALYLDEVRGLMRRVMG